MGRERDPRPGRTPSKGNQLTLQLRRAATLDRQGDTEEAIAAYRAAIARWPDAAILYGALGNLLLRADRAAEAVPVLREALARDPGFAALHCQLGLALLELSLPAEATAAFQDALRLQPDLPEALASLAEALRRQGRLDEAKQAAKSAVSANFGWSEAHLHLGNVLCDRGEFAEACNAYRRALGLKPNDPAAMSNLGIALYGLGQLPASLAQHRMAVSLRPESAGFRYNFAAALLAAGEFEEGWAAYESRLQLGLASSAALDVPQPRWMGEPLAGRTLYLYAEQGFGDTLQFVRYAAMVAERGGRVVLGVPAPLVRLLRRMPGVADVVPVGGGLPEFDLHSPLLSLPHVFKTRLESIPASIPYLAADPALVEICRKRVPQDGQLRVGLVWAGNPRPDQRSDFMDRRRSIPLQLLAPLGAVPELSLISLQLGPTPSELETPPAGLRLLDPMGSVEDFADTAALLAHIDLVISVDTSVAHLAGALGRPVWMLSRYDACWRWLRGRSDSPWYPTMRIYRQPQPGDWGAVIDRVAADLRSWAQQCRGARRTPSIPAAAAG